jgi:predicted ATPase
LHIIATSREALNVTGECAWQVPSLSLPTPDESATTEDVNRSEAVRLFVERAALARPGFALTSQNAASVAHICRRLDGIPLAIELAAARVKTLSVGHLAQRLDVSFDLLTGGSRTALPRHQTLRAAIDWSYDRLSPPDRAFLQRLAVFSGAWTLETSEAVCAGDGIRRQDVFGRLSSLVDRSLVTVQEHGGSEAFRLLEPIRQYALERLVESGESEVFNHRLAAHMADFAERAESELTGPQQAFWLDRLEQEHDSVRTALGWAVQHDLHVALRLALAVWPFWESRLYLREGRTWLEQLVDLSAGQKDFEALRARAPGRESLPLWREVGNKQEVSFVLLNLAHALEQQGDQLRATSLLEESLNVRRELGDNHVFLPAVLALARLARQRQDRAGALALLRESLTSARPLGPNRNTFSILDGLASFALQDGQFVTTVRLLGAGASLLESADFRPPRSDQPDRVRTTTTVRASLSDHDYAAAWAEGQALTPEEVVAQAMEVLDPP